LNRGRISAKGHRSLKPKHLRVTLLVALSLGMTACTSTAESPSPTSTTLPTTVPSTSTVATSTTITGPRTDFPADGPIEAGRYSIPPSAWSVSGVTLSMPEGWESQYGSPGAIKASGVDGEVGFYFVIVEEIYRDPCVGSAAEVDEFIAVGPIVDDLIAALSSQPHTTTVGPTDTTIGGFPAKRIDLTIADDFDAGVCANIPGALQIWHSRPVDKYFVLLPDGSASVYVIDVAGERQVLLTQHERATAEDIAEMEAIIESMEIDS